MGYTHRPPAPRPAPASHFPLHRNDEQTDVGLTGPRPETPPANTGGVLASPGFRPPAHAHFPAAPILRGGQTQGARSTMHPRSRKFRFSQRALDELPLHEPASPSREMEYSDSEVTGLRLLVSKTGRKTYFLRYVFRGRKRAVRLGEHGPLSVLDARRAANELKRQILAGSDPAEAREAQRAMPTFAEFAAADYLPHAKANKRSWGMDESRLRLYLLPLFGRRRLDEISRAEVQRMHNAHAKAMAPATANRILCLLHHMLALAVEWGRLEKNPADGVKKHPEHNERQRYLSKDELRRLGEALDAFPNRVAAAYFRFLLLTGVRKNEALQARWAELDMEQGRWWVPRTKAGEGRWVTLSAAALELLGALPSKPGNPYVFPGEQPGKPYGNAQEAFQKVKALAGIEDDLRIHDLRHSFASMAVNGGATLYQVQRLLGHKQSATTQRYSHISEETLREVSASVAATVVEAQQVTCKQKAKMAG